MKRKLNGDHCQCAGCGQYFNSTAAFDKHRVGPYHKRRCLLPNEMEAIGMAASKTNWWITSKRSDSAIALRKGKAIGTAPVGE